MPNALQIGEEFSFIIGAAVGRDDCFANRLPVNLGIARPPIAYPISNQPWQCQRTNQCPMNPSEWPIGLVDNPFRVAWLDRDLSAVLRHESIPTQQPIVSEIPRIPRVDCGRHFPESIVVDALCNSHGQ